MKNLAFATLVLFLSFTTLSCDRNKDKDKAEEIEAVEEQVELTDVEKHMRDNPVTAPAKPEPKKPGPPSDYVEGKTGAPLTAGEENQINDKVVLKDGINAQLPNPATNSAKSENPFNGTCCIPESSFSSEELCEPSGTKCCRPFSTAKCLSVEVNGVPTYDEISCANAPRNCKGERREKSSSGGAMVGGSSGGASGSAESQEPVYDRQDPRF